MTPKKVQVLIVALIAFAGGYFFGTTKISFDWANYKPNITVINKEPPSSASLVDFNLFWNVWDKLTTNYYDPKAVDPQKLLYGAISGMVSSVGDPYTMFLPPQQQQNFQQQMAGQFTGIGAELSTDAQHHIMVMAPLNGSPAQKAGVKPGDIIVTVDGKSTNGWDLNQAVNNIRGPKNSIVTLGIIHKGNSNPSDVKITRGVITVKSVDGWVKQVKDIPTVNLKNSSLSSDSILYIQLSQFGDSTDTDLENLVNKVVSQVNSGTVKGIVLDLRDNPGGYLTDAQFVAGEFLPNGAPVVKEEDASGQMNTLYVNRTGKLTNTNIPMVVLINKGTASASEILSGALRDNKRAELVGETSFGKGIVQEAIDLGGGAAMHVTISKWLTPNGTWVGNGVNGAGLVPDVTVALDPKDPSHDTQLEKAIQTVLGE
ncbi:MAG TPA: S41 family peptidase [Candidatus Saccharimonadales bacterium]|nr:S41 family peptidase [Candidatus Saccharimonadales bacterium]